MIPRLLCFTSFGSIASSPYRSLKGVYLVVLEVVVLCDDTTFGSSSTDFLLRRLNSVLVMAKKMTLLALLTASLDSRW